MYRLLQRLLVTTQLLAVITPAHAAQLCFAPTVNGESFSLNCAAKSDTFPNWWIGFSTDGDCREGSGCPCSACGPTGHYAWTISASSTDPGFNTGSLSGTDTLYVWLDCADRAQAGITAGVFALAPNGLEILSVAPLDGSLVLDATQPTSEIVWLVGGCPSGPRRALEVVVRESDVISTEGSSWGRVKNLYRIE